MTRESDTSLAGARMRGVIPHVPDIADAALGAALQHRLDQKTKPLGSLGRLEALARQLGEVLGEPLPQLEQPQLLVFAADHGLARQGVSAYPSDVTWQMVENFLAGGAAVSVLARQHGITLTVIDCGVAHDFASRPALAPGRAQLLVRKIAEGSADSSRQPAMTQAQCLTAITNGREVVRSLPGNVVLLGEMGIGNTSAAAMLLARLTGRDIAACTGAGTGLDAAALAHKIGVLARVLQHHADAVEPLAALAAFGGFEIASLVGAVLQAALERRVVLVDGFIVGAAVLVAQALEPAVLQRCVFAHRSGERGHAWMLQYLHVVPLLELDLRLGEGSGAALAWPLLQSASLLLSEMASFATAGVAVRSGSPP
ncbi:MAG TPA: nicotinate-nucleotide--dimethylbenzimidazole phosphoribosyltransferase [Burkholderiaceae bacterium]|nr:nicotinate-nucleotide--dimethylbenzimidazole phosphoribosyltransferase [Burkholderiaceae bacterium]